MSCEAIDAVFKCLQRKFTESLEKHKEDLKFLLRYVKIHLKWKASFALGNMQNWVQDIETCLIQPSRNGSLAANVLEDVLLSLVGNNRIKEDLDRQCYRYYQEEFHGKLFASKHVHVDELMMDYLDPLLDNLKHLIKLNDLNLLAVSIEKIKDLEGKLMSIRNFLDVIQKELETKNNFSPGQDVLFKTSEDLLTKVKVIIENAVNLSYKIWRQSNIFSMEKFTYDLLVKMNHIEPEIRMVSFKFLQASERANLSTLGVDLQAWVSLDSLLSNLEGLKKDCNESSIIPLDYRLLACLHKELSFLKYFLMDPQSKLYIEHEPSFSPLLMKVEAMAREAGILAFSLYDEQKKDDLANEMNLIATNLLEIVNRVKAKIWQVYQRIPKPSISNFPRTPGLSFVDFVMQNLKNLLEDRAGSIAYVKDEIETVLSELSYLSSFIRETITKTEENEHISRRFVDLAYEAECVTDLILASNFPNWHYMLWLYDVIEKLKHLKKKESKEEVYSKKTPDINLSYSHTPQHYYIGNAPVVGFEEEAHMLIQQLIEGPKQLDIVSIVGMAGIGKTTLAKRVYEHPSVVASFPVRSWYCISQVYKRQDLLLNILGDVIELSEEILKMNDEDMDLVLYRSLERKKFLIVIDDIWSIEPWNDICNSFPDDDNGSRILFTSRIPDVARLANPRSYPHYLRFLNDDESWKLLQNKVFKHENCPEELREIGMHIARKCEGLPFSLVLVAGILGKIEKTSVYWRRVLNQLDEQDCEDYSTSCTYILEMSYKNLPDKLKACLLYLGAFPEDTEIPTWKLMRLWIAEGFSVYTENQSQEDVAEDFLMDLIDRNLVLIAKYKSNGGVKSCHVHDLVHEFCLRKAAEENFLLVSKDMVSIEQYRYSCYCQQNTLRGWMPHGANIRSLFFFPNERRSFNFFFDFSILPFVLKLIRVLDLEHIPLKKDKFPTEIELLVHLRYLAVGGELDHLPSSVGNLWRLETLLVMGTKGEVKLPETLLKLAHLKHIYVKNWAAFEFSDASQLETSLGLNSVQELSTLSVRLDDGTLEKISRRLIRLRKLKCILLESRDCDLSPIFLLSHLESLNMTFRGSSLRIRRHFGLYFSSQLRKLTLSNFRLPWSDISRLGCLPNLEVLKLLSEACKGAIWEVPDDVSFLRLKFCKLRNLDLEEWYAGDDAFPRLEQLVVEGCRNLREIPFTLGNSPALNMIKLRRCGYSANLLARRIVEDLQEVGVDDFKLHIQQEESEFEDLSSFFPCKYLIL